jgi:hypothetical protein
LLGRQSKDSKQFNHYFDRKLSDGGGNLSGDFEIAKDMINVFKKFDERIMTGANSLSRL